MKDKIVIVSSWLLVLITALIIFNFSWQPAETSKVTSEDLVTQILGTVMDSEQITTPTIKKAQLPVRKVAHFGIYALLGFTLISAMEKTFKLKKWLQIVISASVCILYGTLDEINQIFRLGRTPYFLDSIIDSCGAITGIFAYVGIMILFNKIMNKQKQKTDKQAI